MSEQGSTSDGTNQPDDSDTDAADGSTRRVPQQDRAAALRWNRIPTLDLPPGTMVGPYKILSSLGEGGFGVVYLAQRSEPHDQRVALKIIKPGMDSKAVIARFEQERQALAVMDHPNVAKVFDAGATPEGRLYFVMQYVKGEPITEYCDRHNLTIRNRLELFIPVCEAVQHAHHKGIIHRDIKPSNVLVSIVDGKPVPTVIDFGVAKAIAHTLTEKTIYTEQGLLIGTPEYMSPEQAEMSALDVDTRTDVYSLGVLLYELLTGALPFDREFLQSKAFDEIRRIIREVDPPRPSTKLTSLPSPSGGGAGGEGVSTHDMSSSAAAISGRRQMQFDALVKQLRSELEWIPMMAMRKDRSQRYKTAVELADDIRSYLAGRPLIAGPEAVSYRLKKFVRRNRSGAIAAGLVTIVLVAGIVGTGLGLVEARRQLDKAERIASFMEDILKGAGPSVALGRDTAMLREMMDGAAARITSGELKDAPEAELRLRLAIGNTDRQLAAYDEATTMLDAATALAESLAPSDGDSADVARALHCRARLLEDLGRAAEAEPLYQQALEMSQRLHKGDHSDVAAGLSSLGLVRQALGRAAEAEPILQQALEMSQRLYKGDHPDVAASLSNVAAVRLTLGHVAEAEPLLEQSLQMRQRLFKGDHPDVADGLSNLAFVLQDLGRGREAEPLFEQSLDMIQHLFKGDHPTVAACMNNLASVRRALGRPAEAEPLYQSALEMYQRLFKGDHPSVAASLDHVGAVRQDLGRLAEAELLYQRALEMRRRLFKGDHPSIAANLSSLAYVRKALGRTAEAEPLYLEALEMYQRLFKGDQPNVARGLNNVAVARQAMGRYAEAEPLFQQALEMNQRLYRGDHPNVASSLENLGAIRRDLGRAAEAEQMSQQALEMFERLFKGDHQDVALCLIYVANARLDLGRVADAEPLLERALAMRQRMYKGDNPDVAASLNLLGFVHYALGRSVDAESLCRQSLEMRRRLFKRDHPELAKSLSYLATVCQGLGRASEAEALLRECLAMRERLLPDGDARVWMRYEAMSKLGEAVADQSRLAEAEPLLLTGYSKLRDDPRVPAPTLAPGSDYKRDALERIVKLYDAWNSAEPGKGYDARAAEWRGMLDALSEPAKPAGEPSPGQKAAAGDKTINKPAQP